MTTSRYSPVAPIALLEELYNRGLLDGYLLLLAQDVLDSPHKYAELVGNIREYATDPFIIMDNGVIELGAPIATARILEAANIVEADCVVTPDILGDFEGTKKLAMSPDVQLIAKDFDLMLIPQGGTTHEVYDCIEFLSRAFGQQYWGVPRWIANEFGSRYPFLNYINTYHNPRGIHLLGMSNNTLDDIHCARQPGIMGIDSANPLVLAMKGISMETGGHAPRDDFWETNSLTELMAYNVEYMHAALSVSTN